MQKIFLNYEVAKHKLMNSFLKKEKKTVQTEKLLGGALQNSCVTNLFKILDKYL